ncbi:pol protein [Cucumis melo var. makuwa]|uniref:Pol protein n=1 Tax=Cucumis melo var. makuwa TaxID=1194695 RepID=A0A5A7TZI8_CUCMM|nr:pol protein [Cucumis melo var. makuwa]TYK28362.1 pol protein [Cucumis melo var. makuwa]
MGPELVQSTNEAIQKIRARMQTAQSRQTSYADVRRKDLEFDVGYKVFLKVAPMKGVLQFEKKGKLSPRFVGPFEILERIGPVAYRLALPPSLSIVHDIFRVSMLRNPPRISPVRLQPTPSAKSYRRLLAKQTRTLLPFLHTTPAQPSSFVFLATKAVAAFVRAYDPSFAVVVPSKASHLCSLTSSGSHRAQTRVHACLNEPSREPTQAELPLKPSRSLCSSSHLSRSYLVESRLYSKCSLESTLLYLGWFVWTLTRTRIVAKSQVRDFLLLDPKLRLET